MDRGVGSNWNGMVFFWDTTTINGFWEAIAIFNHMITIECFLLLWSLISMVFQLFWGRSTTGCHGFQWSGTVGWIMESFNGLLRSTGHHWPVNHGGTRTGRDRTGEEQTWVWWTVLPGVIPISQASLMGESSKLVVVVSQPEVWYLKGGFHKISLALIFHRTH